MYLTWKNIIEIAMIVFGVSQAKLAEKLRVQPAAVSNVQQGKKKTWPLSPVETYEGIFNPSNSKSIANETGVDEECLLDSLKDLLSGNGLGGLVDKCERIIEKRNNENQVINESMYKRFVLIMLHNALKNQQRDTMCTVTSEYQSRVSNNQEHDPNEARQLKSIDASDFNTYITAIKEKLTKTKAWFYDGKKCRFTIFMYVMIL